jgi:hypothetical protein
MVACRESPADAGRDNERESEMLLLENFSSDGVEKNRMLSAYDVMKMETDASTSRYDLTLRDVER